MDYGKIAPTTASETSPASSSSTNQTTLTSYIRDLVLTVVNCGTGLLISSTTSCQAKGAVKFKVLEYKESEIEVPFGVSNDLMK
uniref:Uncharacterized protein n=1 Tax=Amphimedon queenslandica TaxID=400682 RepID=A0A1X7SZD7_AMPQE